MEGRTLEVEAGRQIATLLELVDEMCTDREFGRWAQLAKKAEDARFLSDTVVACATAVAAREE